MQDRDAVQDADSKGSRPASPRVFRIALFALALSNLPYLAGWLIPHEGSVFSGIADIHEDAYSYLLKMREGWEGRWTYDDRYTTEPHRPAALFEFYIALGHLARWLGLPILAMYHVARLGSAVFLLCALDRLVRSLGIEGRARVWAFFLACLGQGLGWAAKLWRADPPPLEQWMTEAYLHQSLVNFPHFAFSAALLAWIFGDFVLLARGSAPRGAFARVALAAFALAWTHPRLSLNVAVVGAFAGLWGWRRGEWPLRPWIAAIAAACAAAAIPSAIILMSMRGDPVWEKWGAIPTATPNPLLMLEGFGLLWPLAAWGAWRGLRERWPWATLLAAWLVAGALMPYLPMISQRRLSQSLGLPLGILAGCAVAEFLMPLLRERLGERAARGLAVAFALLAALSPLWHCAVTTRYCASAMMPWRHSIERAEAMEFLGARAKPEDVVLCAYDSGRMIPALTGARVFVGHWAETIDLRPEKIDAVNRFFNLQTPAEEREAIVREAGITYVLHSGIERAIGGYDPSFEPDRWRRVWSKGGISLYRRQ